MLTDVNRQSVGAQANLLVHPASFYIGAKPLGQSYFWTAGQPQAVALIAARPDGRRVEGVKVKGTVVRREWHRVHRTRGGYSEVYGEWVSDTVARCSIDTANNRAGQLPLHAAGRGHVHHHLRGPGPAGPRGLDQCLPLGGGDRLRPLER